VFQTLRLSAHGGNRHCYAINSEPAVSIVEIAALGSLA
jgi:hypothetical protein